MSDTPGIELATQSALRHERHFDPSRWEVYDQDAQWIATFTDGAYTVTLAGPNRSFAEPQNTSRVVEHGVWVRILPEPFDGRLDKSDKAWLRERLNDRSPDLLALAMQYVEGATEVFDHAGLRIAGDADYGPLKDGGRTAGSDFNDYLGIAWRYLNGTDAPEAEEFGALDCSGFARMLFGFRMGLPLTLRPQNFSIPRRSFEIAAYGPGPNVIRNTGEVPADRSSLRPGDVLFFDATEDPAGQIDHVGIYLGLDDAGHQRFISSRKTANGPTLGDQGGRSILDPIDGIGFYANAFRSAKRF